MAVLTELVGTAALCSTLLLYLTELPLAKQLTVQRSADGVLYTSILVNLVNNIYGFAYGIISSTEVMQITNGVGTILHIIMCLAFIGVSTKKAGAISSTVGAAAFVVGSKFYLDNLEDAERLDTLGLLSTVVCFLAFATPGISLYSAWQERNADLISIPISWGSLICSVTWGIYGILLDNVFIIAPNIPGVVISTLSLVVSSLLVSSKKKE